MPPFDDGADDGLLIARIADGHRQARGDEAVEEHVEKLGVHENALGFDTDLSGIGPSRFCNPW